MKHEFKKGDSMTKSNVGLMCKDCASKPNPKLAKLGEKHFINKYVKLGFETGNSTYPKEHMWVKVKHVKGTQMFGILDNDPMVITTIKCGALIEFTSDEIEDVC